MENSTLMDVREYQYLCLGDANLNRLGCWRWEGLIKEGEWNPQDIGDVSGAFGILINEVLPSSFPPYAYFVWENNYFYTLLIGKTQDSERYLVFWLLKVS